MFFDVSDALRKRCLAVGFLLSMLVDGSSSSHQQQPPAAAPAAAAAGAATTSSSSQNLISSKISEGTFRPPRSVLLRLILRHFWHEIRWCFAVSSGFQKGCLAVAFLLSTLVDGSSSRSSSSTSSSSSRSSSHQQQQSKLDF